MIAYNGYYMKELGFREKYISLISFKIEKYIKENTYNIFNGK